MSKDLRCFLFLSWLLSVPAAADIAPAKGRLLVATDQIKGDVFTETVVLLLHYGTSGAAGLVINRPTDIEPGEVVSEDGPLSEFSGKIYWGGPVQMDSLRALMKTESPPASAEEIVESVYLVTLDEELDLSRDLRVYIGYAGWSAGQLDYELATGSWDVVPGAADLVFAENPRQLWKLLAPKPEYQAALMPSPAR